MAMFAWPAKRLTDRRRVEVLRTAPDARGFDPAVLTDPKATAEPGAYAALYVAGRNREYAIKVFNQSGKDDNALQRAMEAAELEFEMLLKATEDGYREDGFVPRPYCLGRFRSEQGYVYPAIVEEYIQGFTLEDVKVQGLFTGNRPGPIPSRLTVWLAVKIAEAIVFLKEHDITHRDLSNKNIMITRSYVMHGKTDRGIVKIIDFG